ncbi:HTH luxR-type domain-containing protein [Bordetella sputigena]|uniref:LuxR C-terminal-related transcriptional regulator n=1 Tax=Bordetella sputigena TaxID=1416810 RepID=UPI0039F00DC9
MENWEKERIELLLVVGNEKQFFGLLHEIVQRLGFEYYAFAMRLPLPLTNPRLIVHDNCPDNWRWPATYATYATSPYEKVATGGTNGASDALVWSIDLPVECPPFWRDARAHGLKAGWSQVCHGPMGISSALNLASDNAEMPLRDLDGLSPRLTWLAHTAHRGLARLMVPKYMPEARTSLSHREIDILRLTADGKTSEAIGRIMHLSARTVNFHMGKILQKLAAANRTSAALKAAILGLL